MDLHQTAIEISLLILLCGAIGIAISAVLWRGKEKLEKAEELEWEKVFAKNGIKRPRRRR